MNCPSVEPVIDALVDGELDATQQIAILEHLEGCASCSSEYQRLRQLQTDIRAQAPYFRAPEDLRRRVIDSLHPRQPRRTWTWMLSAAASVILLISLAANVALLRTHKSENELVAQQVVSGHVRSTLGTHLQDVISTDRHIVKP